MVSRAPATNTEIDVTDIPLNQSAPLPAFDLHNGDQNCMAQQLNVFLDDLDFDGINRGVHGTEYGHTPIYDTERNANDIRQKCSRHPEWSERQKNAFLFLMYGAGLTGTELKDLFSNNPELFSQMKAMNLIIAEPVSSIVVNPSEDQIRYRLNELSLTSQRLPNRQTMYLFVDLPARLQSNPIGEPSAQISGTSYFLLDRLMSDYRNGKKYSGMTADFGSGTGIQSIALLKMYPQLDTALSLEIDGHSMNLNRLNAMLNGVADRVQVVDNSNPENLKAALGGRPLDLAVSNPPFNIVPHEYESQFTHFGYGGDHGIDITRIFFGQALPVLKKNGEFLYYSFLAQDQKENYYVSKYLKENFKGLTLFYENPDPKYYRSIGRAAYARAITHFMHEHGLSARDPATMAQDIESKLKERDVFQLSEKIGRIVKRGDQGPVSVAPAFAPEPVASRLLEQELREIRPQMMGGEMIRRIQMPKGGIFETMQQVPERRGGVYIEMHLAPNFNKTKKILDLLKKNPKALETCMKDPACKDLFKE